MGKKYNLYPLCPWLHPNRRLRHPTNMLHGKVEPDGFDKMIGIWISYQSKRIAFTGLICRMMKLGINKSTKQTDAVNPAINNKLPA